MTVKDFEGREWDLLQGDDVQYCLESIGYEGGMRPNYLFVLGDCIANGEYGTVYGSYTANLSDTVLQLN